MDKFIGIICMAIVLEGIITYFKIIVVDKKIQWQLMLAIGLGILVSIAYQLDFLGILGLVSIVPFLGNVLTGILISRGSNYLFDLIGKVTKIKVNGVE